MCCFKRSLITRVGVKRRPPGLGNLWLFAPGVGEGGRTRTLSPFVLYQDPLSLIPHDLATMCLIGCEFTGKPSSQIKAINALCGMCLYMLLTFNFPCQWESGLAENQSKTVFQLSTLEPFTNIVF